MSNGTEMLVVRSVREDGMLEVKFVRTAYFSRSPCGK